MAKKPNIPTLDEDTIKSIAGGVASTLGKAQESADALEDAKNNAADASARSIRAMADQLHGINQKLTMADIDAIALTAAVAIGNGNQSVIKSRKSEIKLMLEMRAEMKEVVSKLDELREEGHNFNLRVKTLSTLRQLRKDTALEVSEAVEGLRETLDAPAPTKEMKLVAYVDKLSANKAFRDEKGKLLPKAAKAIAALHELAAAQLEDEQEPEPEEEEEEETTASEPAPEPEAPATTNGTPKKAEEGEVDEELMGFDLSELMNEPQ